MKVREEVIKMEKALLTREVRDSADKIRQFLSEDFKEIGAGGSYFGIKEVLASATNQDYWSAYPENWEFRQLSPEIAQVLYRVKIVRGSARETSYSLRTSIWRKEVGTWKMVYHQGTKLAPSESKP